MIDNTLALAGLLNAVEQQDRGAYDQHLCALIEGIDGDMPKMPQIIFSEWSPAQDPNPG